MPYATTNPPRLIAQSVGTTGGKLWLYSSSDAATAVRVNGYFTNGWDLGMRVGDAVLQVGPAGAVGHIYVVNQASATAGVDVTDGTAITATDTD